jgi:hypothetical protein
VPTRSIFIGDVHGCARELERLLDSVQWSSSDRVYFVGDLVARGPKSPDVLEIFRRIQARGVLGNHEDRLLEARDARRAGRTGPHLSPSHESLMTRLSDEDWALLEMLPLSLDVPEHDVRVVHAGVVPGVPLAKQQRRDLLKMRALEPDGTATSSWRERSWAADYPGPPHVVFGHNALSGVQLHPHATGLDSACVYGGALTALVLPAGARVPPPEARRALLVSVQAAERYVDLRSPRPGQPASE